MRSQKLKIDLSAKNGNRWFWRAGDEFPKKYIVDEKGSPTAVILPIAEYRKMLSVMGEVEDHRESRLLSQSPEFKKLVKKGLDDIRAGRTRHWKEAWDEL